MAPGEGWTHHGGGEFSGVNGTPLLREAEFTHAPSLRLGIGWLELGGKARKVTGKKLRRGRKEGGPRGHRGFLE